MFSVLNSINALNAVISIEYFEDVAYFLSDRCTENYDKGLAWVSPLCELAEHCFDALIIVTDIEIDVYAFFM